VRARVTRLLLGAAAVTLASIVYVWLTTPDVRRLRTENPTSTAFMGLRAAEAARGGNPVRRVHRWVGYEHIAPSLKRAVLVSEDAGFYGHDGVDYEEIRVSLRQNWSTGKILRGASTLTQQLAKNLYLSPSRNPYRKLGELFIARRLEAELTKRRIFELYLNLIEWGDGIWGAEAAARSYFGTPASALSAEQSALLAGAIINPRIYSPAHPNARLLSRQRIILGRMGDVTPPPNLSSMASPAVSTPASTLPVTNGLPSGIIK
jgi:monofunctional biosynthetic peptidoglycan transglycosylase